MKAKHKTPEEIQTEIAALEACKTYIPPRTKFGDDNIAKLDLQIEELRHGIDDTAEEWEDYSDDEQSVIMEARDWKEGQIEEAPSTGWDNYKPQP